MIKFKNRNEAGRFLAEQLSAYANRPDTPALSDSITNPEPTGLAPCRCICANCSLPSESMPIISVRFTRTGRGDLEEVICRAPFRADDPGGHSLADAQRIAHCENHVAHAHVIRIAQRE